MKQKRPRLFNRVSRETLIERIKNSDEARTTLSFYCYHQIQDPQNFRDEMYLLLEPIGVLGRIYVATEGVNAQVSVPTANFDLFKTALYSIPFLNGCRLNIAVEDDGKSFIKLDIKVRTKIVADGLDDSTFDPSNYGVHLSAADFNEIVADPDTILVDMRNHYESEVGHFEGAICPDVDTFRDALPVVAEVLKGKEDKKIVMYCTGGIRCEKASAYYKHQGFKNVFQLNGGIIEYARQVKAQGLENRFKGVNFVFDERLGERISEEVIAKCHQCGSPCDTHANCANEHCHILFIQCPTCAAKFGDCCSVKCHDFSLLPKEKQKELRMTTEFNGTKFGKGRYKAHNASEGLIL